ncbi:MAG: GrpB family protein [Pseudohongiellaceae bacterium]
MSSTRSIEFVGMEVGSTITLCSYTARWVNEFQRVAAELRESCGDHFSSIQHVGSTSVPGLDAKPIIDILIEVRSLKASLCLVPTMERLGFVYRPDDELPDRHYFPRSISGLRCHHVSFAEKTSRHFKNTIAFRDALRNDERLMHEYAALKLKLAATVGEQRMDYLNGKTGFILSVLKELGCETQGEYPVEFGLASHTKP